MEKGRWGWESTKEGAECVRAWSRRPLSSPLSLPPLQRRGRQLETQVSGERMDIRTAHPDHVAGAPYLAWAREVLWNGRTKLWYTRAERRLPPLAAPRLRAVVSVVEMRRSVVRVYIIGLCRHLTLHSLLCASAAVLVCVCVTCLCECLLLSSSILSDFSPFNAQQRLSWLQAHAHLHPPPKACPPPITLHAPTDILVCTQPYQNPPKIYPPNQIELKSDRVQPIKCVVQ